MGRRRWWPGAFDSSKRRREERAAAEAPAFAHVALVVGSTDDVGAALLDVLLGPDAPAGPWKVYALSHRALLPSSASAEASSSSNRSTVVRLHVDLADSAAVAQVLAPLTDITHVFYTGWTPFPGSTEAEAREANCGMLRKVLSAVVPNCPALAHVCLQTGRRPLMGVHAAARPQREDLPRLDYPHLEDALLDELADSDGAAITWSVHRPSTIFGLSPRSTRNVAAGLCAYAAICGEEGVTLRWPGSREAWEGVIDPSDAELVAEHALWAALDPDGKTNAFNSTKGNVFKWKELWPMLAMHFQLEWSGYDGESKRFKLVEAMAGKEDVWAQIVEEKKLAGTGLDNITTWWLVDAVINIDKEHLSTMTKDKDHGLFGFWNVLKCNKSERKKSMCDVVAYIWMMFIFCTFLMTQVDAKILVTQVAAKVHGTCPKQSVAYYILPKNTCPVVHVTGDHWLHSKARQQREFHQAYFHFGEIFYTNCSQWLDIILILGCLINWPKIWALNSVKRVRIFYADRLLILVWIDMAVVSMIYYCSWEIYGSMLSHYSDYHEFGNHIFSMNLVCCILWLFYLAVMLCKHGRVLKARWFMYFRILPLACAAILCFGLKDIEPDEEVILFFGLFGCVTMLLMYTLKWVTIMEFKLTNMVLNICAIPILLLCFELHKLRTCYGWACVGSIVFRLFEIKKSYSLVPNNAFQQLQFPMLRSCSLACKTFFCQLTMKCLKASRSLWKRDLNTSSLLAR